MRDTDALRVAWYRFARTLKARWTGYLALTLLLGLVGGLALGSLAAARRTQAAFPAYLAATNPSRLTVLTGLYGVAGSNGYDPAVIARIAALPGVSHVASYGGFNVAVLAPGATPTAQTIGDQGLTGSIDGEFFTTDKVTVVQGRMPDPGRAGEAAFDAAGAPSPVQVGTVAPLGFFTNAQLSAQGPGTRPLTPYLKEMVKITGKVVYSSEEAQDDVDVQRDGGPLFTPALTRLLDRCCAAFTETAVQLDPGTGVPAAEAAIQRVLPAGFPIEFYVTAQTTARAQRAIEPTSLALAVFGAIAAVACLLICGQVIGRQLRADARDLGTLRALGASPAATAADGLPGTLAAVAAGTLLACAVAVGLSPIAPLGPVRAVYPDGGVAADPVVLAGGAAVLAALLGLIAAAIAVRRAPHRGSGRAAARAGAAARLARAIRLPPSAAEGVRLALDPWAGRDPVPARSAAGAAVLAFTVLLATVTFGSSLSALVSHPALYGWNWTYALSSGQGSIDRAKAAPVLDHDKDVAAWTGIWYGTASVDGLTVPLIGATAGAAVAPPLLSGRGLRGPGDIVLGPQTLAALHKRVGNTVTVADGGPRQVRLRIAGTETLPSIGVSGTLHTEMGTGAVLPYQDIPGAAADAPDAILVTLRPGADLAAQQAVLQRIVPVQNGGVVSSVQRPAEIVNYRSMGTAPALLAGALALGAAGSLWLALAASVRRRRRELALLKTLGFTRRQHAGTVAAQSTTAVAVGAVAGVPLGIALGRLLWDEFARQISVVPEPAVPAATVAVIVAGALVTANLVAALPGLAAARTRAAAFLRAE